VYVDDLDVEERGIGVGVVSADLIGRSTAAERPLSATPTTGSVNSSTMGRTPTKSVARVYTDVNAKLGPSWHEYGQSQSFRSAQRPF
jgi:hypothetical protein